MEPIEGLKEAVVAYDAKAAVAAAKQAVAEGVDLFAALDAITQVLKDIGERYGCGELWLPDLVGAAHAAQAAMPIIDAEIARTGQQTKRLGTVVVGTVAGDIHDIGKAMVASLLTAHGFKVIDLGTDVATNRFVEAVKEHEADILALSALLTTTAAQQQKVIAAVKEAGLRDNVKILIGGGAVNSDFAKHVGADGYGDTAAEGVEIARELLGL